MASIGEKEYNIYYDEDQKGNKTFLQSLISQVG